MSNSDVPSEWKHALITPLFKSSSTSDRNNYRPISILPVLSKILERAVHTQLMDYLENKNLFSRNQFGYRRHRSTDAAAVLLIDNIRKEIDKGNIVGVIFMDLSNDTIGNSIMLEKLSSYGIAGDELCWFTNYLFNCTQQVVIDYLWSRVWSRVKHVILVNTFEKQIYI